MTGHSHNGLPCTDQTHTHDKKEEEPKHLDDLSYVQHACILLFSLLLVLLIFLTKPKPSPPEL